MPVVNVNLLVDEKTYAAVQAGVLELCGIPNCKVNWQ